MGRWKLWLKSSTRPEFAGRLLRAAGRDGVIRLGTLDLWSRPDLADMLAERFEFERAMACVVDDTAECVVLDRFMGRACSCSVCVSGETA